MTRHPIWLVRHASTEWTGVRWCGRADPPLADRGIRDADDLAASLAPELPPTTRILASPARRTLATARAVAGRGGLRIEVDADLVEVDVGRAEGLTFDDRTAREPALAEAIAAGDLVDWPDGESRAELEARAGRAAKRIRSIADEVPVVVVSHGALLHAVARHLDVRPSPPPFGPAAVLRIRP